MLVGENRVGSGHLLTVIVNFMHRDGWSVHCLAEDAKTSISPFLTVKQYSTLIRLLRACGASDEKIVEVERDMARWGRGSSWLVVNEQGRKLLRIVS
jgi:hypothetical protein